MCTFKNITRDSGTKKSETETIYVKKNSPS